MKQEEVGWGWGRQRQKAAPQSLPPSLWLPGSLPRSEWARGHPSLLSLRYGWERVGEEGPGEESVVKGDRAQALKDLAGGLGGRDSLVCPGECPWPLLSSSACP